MNALNVAKYVINYALESNSPISNLQLQKVLYFLDGEYFSKVKEFLINDAFAAYPLGPVNESVYQVYKGYGVSKIFDCNTDIKLDNGVDEQLVKSILSRRVKMSVYDLVEESRKKGKAWDKTVLRHGMYTKINKQLMKEDFAHI